MTRSPTRRLCLFVAPDGAVEIIVLGGDDVAPVFVAVHKLAESWGGFERVDPLVHAGAAVGVRVTIAPLARLVSDPVGEVVRALKSRDLPAIGAAWTNGVATW